MENNEQYVSATMKELKDGGKRGYFDTNHCDYWKLHYRDYVAEAEGDFSDLVKNINKFVIRKINEERVGQAQIEEINEDSNKGVKDRIGWIKTAFCNTSLNGVFDDVVLYGRKKAGSGSREENNIHENDAAEVEKKVTAAIKDSQKRNIIFTGAPGTGKTYSVEKYVDEVVESDEAYRCFVQFHSSFDYTDFVEGLRPVLDENGNMVFVRMDGIFKQFCRTAIDDEGNDYYFIIDEINRADLSRVFGELMYCFEKRGEEHKVKTQYQNLPTYVIKDGKAEPMKKDEDKFADCFYIPENVIVIGTMNDIDRSVETFDFALRRRFDWVNIKANEVMQSSLISMKAAGTIGENVSKADLEQLSQRVISMNNVISDSRYGLNEDYHIGPAYFNGYDGSNLESIFENNISPILHEYLRGRATKLVNDFIEACHKALVSADSVSGDQE